MTGILADGNHTRPPAWLEMLRACQPPPAGLYLSYISDGAQNLSNDAPVAPGTSLAVATIYDNITNASRLTASILTAGIGNDNLMHRGGRNTITQGNGALAANYG